MFVPPHLQISTVLGVAVKDQREESAWSEGVAIWVAVIVVSGVGASRAMRICFRCMEFGSRTM